MEEQIISGPASPCTDIVATVPREKTERKRSPLTGIAAAVLVLIAALMPACVLGIGGRIAKEYSINVFGKENVRLTLNGPASMTVNYGEEYIDPGAAAMADGNELAVRSTKPDTRKIGKQKIVYSCTYNSTVYAVERELSVIDSEPPVITVGYANDEPPTWMTAATEYIVEAADNVDGDLTSKITARTENGKTIYTVTDSSGNTCEKTVNALKKDEAPVITVDAEIEVCYEDEPISIYTGYRAVDGSGNDLTQYVEIDDGDYDGGSEGTYEILYTLTNRQGETVSAKKTVIVLRHRNPEYVLDERKTIFLTFDGGPSATLYPILDTLDKYGVPATFFVSATNNSIQYISDIAASGHSIGVYTYSNNLSSIYRSFEAFDEDFGKIQEVVSRATGDFTNLMRFPSGSGTVYGQTADLQRYYENEGFQVIGWTGDPGEGYAATTAGAATLADAAIAAIREGYKNIIRLHDNSEATVGALEDIILWGLNNDYTFLRY